MMFNNKESNSALLLKFLNITRYGKIFPIGIPILVLAFLAYSSDESEKIISKLQDTLSHVDSIFQTIVSMPEMRRKNLQLADNIFKQTLTHHNYFNSFKRTNSKGILVNAIESQAQPPQIYSDVSQNEWFQVPAKTLKPYFSSALIKNKKDILIWSRPLFITGKNDQKRFGGAVVTQIDLENLLKNVMAEVQGSVRCVYKNHVLYTSSWTGEENYQEYLIKFNNQQIFRLQYLAQNPNLEKNQTDTIATLATTSMLPADSQVSSIESGSSYPRASEAHKFKNETNISEQSANNQNLVMQVSIFVALFLILIFLTHKLLTHGSKSASQTNDPDNTIDNGLIVMDEEEHRKIEKEESVKLRKQVISEIKEEIRSHILKNESTTLTTTVRKKVYQDIYEQIARDEGDLIGESVKNELRDFYTNELNKSICKQVKEERSEELKDQALQQLQAVIRDKIRAEEGENIQQKVYAKISQEVYAQVKSKHEEEFRKNAINKLNQQLLLQVKEVETENLTREIINNLKLEIREEIEKREKDTFYAELREKYSQEIFADIKQQEHDDLYAQVKKKVEDEIRELIVKNDSLLIRNHEWELLTNQIKQDLAEQHYDKIMKQEREQMREDIIAFLKSNEYADMLDEQREKMRIEIADKVKTEEYTARETEERDKLLEHVREQISKNELDSITDTVRQEMAQLIKAELEEKEKAQLYHTIKHSIRDKLHADLENNELAAMKSQLLQELVEKEKKRIEEVELPGIREKERTRLTTEEYHKIRKEVLLEIHNKEISAIRQSVKEEIYEETIDDIRKRLKEKIQIEMSELLTNEKIYLEQKIRESFRKNIQQEYHYLIGIVNTMDTALKNTKPLDSLRETVSSLNQDKRQYEHYNLNSMQTESLLEYLERLHGNFDSYFNGLASTLSNLKSKASSILNSLGNENDVH